MCNGHFPMNNKFLSHQQMTYDMQINWLLLLLKGQYTQIDKLQP